MESSLDHTLRVDLGPSPLTGCVLALAHTGAALGAFALPGSPWSTSVACAVLALGAWRSLARHAFRRGSGAIVAVGYSASEGWWLASARGEDLGRCELIGAFVHPALSVVSWSTPRGRVDVLFPRGALSPGEARRLRVTLRRIEMRASAEWAAARRAGALSSLRAFAAARVRGALRRRPPRPLGRRCGLRCPPAGPQVRRNVLTPKTRTGAWGGPDSARRGTKAETEPS